jgi:hypothetical protein
MNAIASHAKLENMHRFLEHGPTGAVVEVGVYQGGSLHYLATRHPDRDFYGFDTFAGMPPESEFDNHHRQGDFQTSLAEVQQHFSELKNVVLIQGLYPDSDVLKPRPITLAHIDADLYSSTLNAMEEVLPRMAPGGRIYCDDAFQRTCHGATLAVCEFCTRHKLILLLDNDQHACIQV